MKCAKCRKKIRRKRPGGLLFSTPEATLGLGWPVVKYHLCPKCYKKVLAFVLNGEL